MGFSVDFRSDSNIVAVQVEGRINYNLVKQFSTEALKIARREKCYRFLINHFDSDLQNGVYNIHSDGSELEQFGFKNTDKIAFVLKRIKADTHFDEVFDGDVKWCSNKYFDNEEDAIKWLLLE